MALDFPNAQLPRLAPLERSFVENEVEAELKGLFVSLFDAMLAPAVFDVNVLGAPHLGSFDLVRRTVNADGLALLQGDREEAATRYLYRAWKSGGTQGRGLHFLRTYLQMLFPNQCEIEHRWQEKAAPYPTSLRTTLPVGQEDEYFLTSRVRVLLYFGVETQEVHKLAGILQSVTPARLVPEFAFLLKAPPVKLRFGGAVVSAEIVDVLPHITTELVTEVRVGVSAAVTAHEFISIYPQAT